MSKPDPTHYRCRNCREITELDDVEADNYETPLCPHCRVESLSKMLPVSCPDCGGRAFTLHHADKINGAKLQVECVRCDRIGAGDESAVWW